ncbi:MAG: type II toxin-antitoxin system VapC family toxin [Hydrogenophilales bacterium]|nr:type II toxin-antitoxin system VapC family toxin [Hydrogenophilales bacterium]
MGTNVLVRYIAQDEATQSARATRFIENECSASAPGFVGLIVLVEVVWVSESCYGATRAEIAEIVRRLLSIKQLVVQDAEICWQALRLFESGKADFADCLIERSANAAGCKRVMTFDKQASKAGMALLK